MENVALELKGITKHYPGVVALNNVSLSFLKGEVHALIGENGAGKSTLIKIISGAISPNAGQITIDGASYPELDPFKAKNLGIETIYQEFNLVESLSVAENISFGEQTGMLADFSAINKKAVEVFNKMQVNIDIKAIVSDLSTAQKQLVEIAKAISRKARILIMDEPSASLSVAEVEIMLKIVRELRTQGVTIIYISHRLEELFEISDRVSVMRDGEYITTLETAKTSTNDLISLMVGRELTETYPERKSDTGEVALEVKNLCGNGLSNISFSLKKGEIVGIAGLVGAGRTELARLIIGADKVTHGQIFINGKEEKIRLPLEAIGHGIGLIPEDRKLHGCFLEMSIAWNTTIASLKNILKGKFVVDEKKELEIAREYKAKMNTKTPTLSQKVKNLSGGNQQKVVLSKTLAANPNILIFDEPTRGIDVGAKQEIYHLIRSLAEEGKAILMISSDMNELLGMSDKIFVMYSGRFVGELMREDFNQHKILEMASGLN